VVQKAQWSEKKGEWEIEAHDRAADRTVQDSCHILIHACGYLNKLAWPKIPGLEKYEGVKLHSADYDDTISLKGKDVILIGNGSASCPFLIIKLHS
jgi:cation diffusion facilitator CzcD-associated flavoprotein CzcO